MRAFSTRAGIITRPLRISRTCRQHSMLCKAHRPISTKRIQIKADIAPRPSTWLRLRLTKLGWASRQLARISEAKIGAKSSRWISPVALCPLRFGASMKAIIFEQHGGPEVLRLAEVPDPQIKTDEVLVEVRACALNHLDVWVRCGLPGIKIPLPHILGNDIAGVVREVGELVTWAKPGDEVMVQPGVSCGHCGECLAGHDNMCDDYDIIGYRRDGGYAELVAVPGLNLIPKPSGLTWPEAAALPLVTLTAWHMLVTRANIQPGEDVLVHAAGSGVGSIGIQIAKLRGAKVIATASSDEKLTKARELGADETIDYTRDDWSKEVRRMTNGRGVDIVFEHTGATTWPG